MTPAQEVDAVLARFGLVRIGEPEPVAESLLNRNYRAATDGGPFFVRLHRPKGDLARLELEAAAMDHCAERGIPVPLPLRDLEGRRFVHKDGHFTSLYPWVEGRLFGRAMGVNGAAVLGDMEGRLQAALRDFPHDGLSVTSMGVLWDTAETIQTLSAVENALAEKPASDPVHQSARDLLRRQLSDLEQEGATLPPSAFDSLTRQATFGDYHYRNVMVDQAGDRVVAVVDWEMVCVLPPVFELLRAVQYSGLGRDEMEAWVQAFGRHQRLSAAECHASVEMRWQYTRHTIWALKTVYLEDDPGPSRFFAEMIDTLEEWSDVSYRRWLGDLLARELAP